MKAVILCVLLLATFTNSLPIRPVPENSNSSSSNSPVLYLTFHGGNDAGDVNNIYSYDLEGKLLGKVIADDSDLDELRGMTLIPTGEILFCNANKNNSRILALGQCDPTTHQRPLLGTVIPSNPAMVHPYGITLAGTDVYISAQDGNVAVSYYTDKGVALNSLVSGAPVGTFLEMDAAGMSRGITNDGTRLFLCREAKDHVHVYKLDDGSQITKISISKPISAFADVASNTLAISSNDDKNPAVCLFHLDTLQQIRCVPMTQYPHPSGVLIYGDTVFVASHDAKLLLSFSLAAATAATPSETFKVLAGLPDDPEQILLSPC